MPTENERKYVLCLDSEEQISKIKSDIYLLKQGYLAFAKGMSLRIRHSQSLRGKEKYRLCYKQKVCGRVIEIEKKIDERDFKDLWSISLSQLEKVRHIINCDGATWEIDFFKTHNSATYFAMAECEMPEGQTVPKIIPKFIQKNLIYSVPPDCDQFSSKRLASVRHAKKLYKDLLAEHEKKETKDSGF